MTIHPFLAVTDINQKGYLVVEGWLPDYALEEAIQRFRDHPYEVILTTGVPLETGYHLSEYKDYAHLAKESLIAIAGDPSLPVIAVPTPHVERNRTYATAVKVREWFQAEDIDVRTLDVVTVGVHARRSRLLYQLVFGNEVSVGVWSVADADYEAGRWWAGSEGVKQTLTEFIGYCYVRLFFRV